MKIACPITVTCANLRKKRKLIHGPPDPYYMIVSQDSSKFGLHVLNAPSGTSLSATKRSALRWGRQPAVAKLIAAVQAVIGKLVVVARIISTTVLPRIGAYTFSRGSLYRSVRFGDGEFPAQFCLGRSPSKTSRFPNRGGVTAEASGGARGHDSGPNRIDRRASRESG